MVIADEVRGGKVGQNQREETWRGCATWFEVPESFILFFLTPLSQGVLTTRPRLLSFLNESIFVFGIVANITLMIKGGKYEQKLGDQRKGKKFGKVARSRRKSRCKNNVNYSCR